MKNIFKKEKFSIRKFTVGAVSVVVGASLLATIPVQNSVSVKAVENIKAETANEDVSLSVIEKDGSVFIEITATKDITNADVKVTLDGNKVKTFHIGNLKAGEKVTKELTKEEIDAVKKQIDKGMKTLPNTAVVHKSLEKTLKIVQGTLKVTLSYDVEDAQEEVQNNGGANIIPDNTTETHATGEANTEPSLPEGKVPTEQKGDFETGEANVQPVLPEGNPHAHGEANTEPSLPEGKVPTEQKGDFETGEANVQPALPEGNPHEHGEANTEPSLPEGKVPTEQKGDFETGEANVQPSLPEVDETKIQDIQKAQDEVTKAQENVDKAKKELKEAQDNLVKAQQEAQEILAAHPEDKELGEKLAKEHIAQYEKKVEEEQKNVGTLETLLKEAQTSLDKIKTQAEKNPTKPENNKPAYEKEIGKTVELSEDKKVATFKDNDGNTPVKVTIPTEGLDNDVEKLEVEKAEVANVDKKNNDIYDVHFTTTTGTPKQIKQNAKVEIPVERKVAEAYHIETDGTGKISLDFLNKEVGSTKYVEIIADHFSLIGIRYEEEKRDEKQDEVVIKDPLLKKLINKNIDAAREDNQVITKEEIESLTKINLRDKNNRAILESKSLLDTPDFKFSSTHGIKDISGLENAVNLEELNLNENEISDLKPLEKLTKLKTLNLNRNRISDLTPLANLTNLEYLDLYTNKLVDISPLKNLVNLKFLDLHNNDNQTGDRAHPTISGGIENIDAVKDMKKLELLSLGHNNITNFDVIKDLNNIKDLVLGANHVSDYTKISDFLLPRIIKFFNEGEGSVNFSGQSINYNKEVEVSSNKVAIDNPFTGVIELGVKLGEELGAEEKVNLFSDATTNVEGVTAEYDIETNKVNFNFTKEFLEHNNGKVVPVNVRFTSALECTWGVKNINLKITSPQEENKVVVFKDSNLKETLLKKLKSYNGEDEVADDMPGEYNLKIKDKDYRKDKNDTEIYEKDMEELEAFAIRGYDDDYNDLVGDKQIKDLTGLEKAVNLKQLTISGNSEDSSEAIKDITPLKGLKNLEFLRLSHNALTDISSLAEITSLKYLYISHNQISDVSSLKTLVNLEDFDIGKNKVSNVEVVKNMPKLKTLVASTNKLDNINIIKDLIKLEWLDVKENKIKDISAVANLHNLKNLYLNNNIIEDASAVENLTSLEDLDLRENKISSINLAKLENLTQLNLSKNNISDISSINNLTKLKELYLSDNKLTAIDFSKLVKLDNADLSGNMIKDFSSIVASQPDISNQKVNFDKEVAVKDATVEIENPFVNLEKFAKEGKVTLSTTNSDIEATLKDNKIIFTFSKDLVESGNKEKVDLVFHYVTADYREEKEVFLNNISFNFEKKEVDEVLNLSTVAKSFYKELFNKWSNVDKKYTNLTDDANKEYVVNGKAVKEPKVDDNFTAKDFEKLVKFSNNQKEVNDDIAKWLEYATNLEVFDVESMSDNVRNIKDWNFLTKLKKLATFYYLNQNDTKERVDVSTLSLTNNTNLKDVRVPKGNLISLDFVKGLSLRQLDVEDNDISNIDAIKDMASLVELHLDNNSLENDNLDSLVKLTNLETLYLKNNREISDINKLSVLKNLEALELKHMNVSDISVVKEFPKLRRLVIEGNPLAKNYMEVIKTLNLNTGYLGEISKEDFEWLKTYANRDAVEAKNPENSQREFTFTKLPLTIEVKKSEIKDGKVSIDNPLRDWTDVGVGLDSEKEAPEGLELSEDMEKLTLTLGNELEKVFKYDAYLEDYDHLYGKWNVPAGIHGRVELTIKVIDNSEKEKVKVETYGDFIKVSSGEVNKGDEVEVTLTPDAKRYPISFKVNGEEKVAELKEENNVYTYKFIADKDADVRVIYQETRKLTLNGGGLSVEGKDITKLNHGEKVVVKITPPKGKVISKFTETNYNSHGEVALNGNNNTNKLDLVKDNEYVINNLDYDTVLNIEYMDRPTTPNAESDFIFEKATGTIKEYKSNARKDVIIPDEIDGVKVEHIGEYAFSGIDSVVFPKYLKTIEDAAFQLNNLKEVVIPEGVEKIGELAFNGNKIEKLVLPKSLKTIGVQAFRTNNLKEVVVPEGVTVLKEVFAKNKLEKVTLLKDVKLSGEGIFANNNLKTITLPTMTEIPARLLENNKLETIEISEGVVKIGEKAFFNNELTSVKVATSVKNIANMAFANNRLTEVTLPETADVYPTAFDDNVKTNLPKKELEYAAESDFTFDKESKTITSYNGSAAIVKIPETIGGVEVEHIGYTESGFGMFKTKLGAFEYDAYDRPTKIYKVILPKNLKSIDDNAFKNSDLHEIELPDSLEKIGEAAFEGNKIKKVELPKVVKTIGASAFKDNNISEVNLEDVVELGAFAFANNKIGNVRLSSELGKIAEGVFENNNLHEITLGEKITSIGDNAFAGNALSALVLPDKVELIGDNAFLNNGLSSNLVIPESVKVIGANAFSGNNLGKLSVLGGAEIKKRAFYRAGVTDVNFADGVNISGSESFGFNPLVKVSIPKGTITLGAYSFERNLLESVILPDTLETIGDGAFEVNNLKEVTIPKSVKTIGTAAFFNNKLGKVVFADGLGVIGEGSFQKNKLVTIEIPKSVTAVKKGAFKENNITEVVLYENTTNEDGFDSGVAVSNI